MLLFGLVFGATALLLVVFHFRRQAPDSAGAAGEFAYDLEKFMEVDPALIRYRRAAVFDSGFEQPRGVAWLPQALLCVAGDKGLRILDREGKLVSEVSLGGSPICVAGSKAGSWYVGFHDHVEVFDATTRKRVAMWKSLGAQACVTSLDVAPREVYVADAGQRVVWRLDLSGNKLGQLGRKDKARNIPGLFVPSPHLDVAMAPDGLLRVVNPGRHRIEAYTPDGHLEISWGKYSPTVEGFCGCCNPCGMALLPGGGFVTCEKGIPRVKEYDASGKFVGVVAAPREFAEAELAVKGERSAGEASRLDVAVDSEGRVFVLDPLARKVKVFVKATEG